MRMQWIPGRISPPTRPGYGAGVILELWLAPQARSQGGFLVARKPPFLPVGRRSVAAGRAVRVAASVQRALSLTVDRTYSVEKDSYKRNNKPD